MRLGFFFGAGAEIGYGLPSGGKFAIDLFRQDASRYKVELRTQLRAIDSTTPYATYWLPPRYVDNSIYAFGRNEFTSIIESSIEYKRDEIIRRLNNFDQECDKAIRDLGIDRILLGEAFHALTGIEIGERRYQHAIRLNEMLARDVQLFGSENYSAMLDIIKLAANCDDLKRYVTAFLQLLVGAHGQDLVQRLNQELFDAAPDDLPIFDDLTGMFRLEFNRVGSTALELLLEENRRFELGENADANSLFCAIAQQVLENIFTTVLDYQQLIDSHFRYLFSPSTEWAKFTRMVIFLKIARHYINSQAPDAANLPDHGYYHDLAAIADGVEISAVGTANYNSILAQVFAGLGVALPEVIHLNGSVNDYYNPYKNTVVTVDRPEDVDTSQIHVPFILTQSGLKPLTSVAMSRRYVKLFDSFADSDAIVAIGFGFNKDDSHINGLFRELLEVNGRRLFVISVASEGSAEEQKRKLRNKLRISHAASQLLTVIPVDPQNRQVDGQLWMDRVLAELNPEGQQ